MSTKQRFLDLNGDDISQFFILFQVLIFSTPIWLHGLFDSTKVSTLYRSRKEEWHQYLLKIGVTSLLFALVLAVGNDSSSEFLYFQF